MILIHGGDQNVLRAKDDSFRGKYDEMKMKEGKNIVQYMKRIKEVASFIRAIGGTISNEEVVSKFLRELLPIYVIIRVSSIHEFRAMSGNFITLDGLVGRLITFE